MTTILLLRSRDIVIYNQHIFSLCSYFWHLCFADLFQPLPRWHPPIWAFMATWVKQMLTFALSILFHSLLFSIVLSAILNAHLFSYILNAGVR